MIRRATENDLSGITAIYNQAIESRKATGNMEKFTPEQRKPWFSSHNKTRTPVFVYEDCGRVAGYCYLSEYRPGRQALETVAEISCFIDSDHHRKGIGSKLVLHMIAAAVELGYKNLLAIVMSCNAESIAMLERFNFELWGTLPDVAFMGDNVCSHLFYGLKLTTV